MLETKFRTHTEPQGELFLYIVIFMFLGSRREDKSQYKRLYLNYNGRSI
jgi:hypothetical protein